MHDMYLNPWDWHVNTTGEAYWRALFIDDVLATNDFRGASQISDGPIAQGVGLFFYSNLHPGMELSLGDDIEANITVVQKSGFATLLGVNVASENWVMPL